MTTAARVPYLHSVVPARAEELPTFLRKEVQLLQRAGAKISITTQTTNYLIAGNDEIVLMDTTSGPLSATLPVEADSLNLRVIIKNIGANLLTIVGDVDATTDPTLTQWKALEIVCDSAAYYAVGVYP